MKARGSREGEEAEADPGLGQDLEAGGGGPGLEADLDQGEDLDPDLGGQDPIPVNLAKSQKVVRGANQGLKVDPRAEIKREVVRSRVPDQSLDLDPVIDLKGCLNTLGVGKTFCEIMTFNRVITYFIPLKNISECITSDKTLPPNRILY